ncbi:MAG: hypothetical protein K2O81_02055 [Clostridia bacterium]|nr:hypothetical protein [Clostridia bacterium]
MLTYSGGAITVKESGLCSATYNLVYLNDESAEVTAVLTLNGVPFEVTRRMLQGQSGVGATYLFPVKAGDVIQVEVDGTQSLEHALLNTAVKFYTVNQDEI